MPSFKRNNRLDHSSTTNLSMPMATDKCSIPTICINVSETNNNTIDSLSSPPVRPNLLQCLPEILTDIELNGEKTKMNHNLSEAFVKGDLYKPYIFGKLSIFRQKTGRILRGVFFIQVVVVEDGRKKLLKLRTKVGVEQIAEGGGGGG